MSHLYNHHVNRRSFLQAASMAAAPLLVPASSLGKGGAVAANNRITMGMIGTGNQGTSDMRAFLDDDRVQMVAVCDLNRESPGYWNGAIAGREPARQYVEWHYAREKRSGVYQGCDTYHDFRELLARKDIDAIGIAVPDHWHALVAIEAARAGKDIYGQKPLALTIAEGRAMVSAVTKHQRVFQCGSQQRSDARFRKACEMVRNGRIGKLQTVKCGLPGGTPDFSKDGARKATEPVPDGFDYNFWLGPAPDAPYCPARCHVDFRWILDYSGGQITDWGGHHPDIAQWAMGTEDTGPVAIRNGRATWSADAPWNTATSFYYEADYASGVKLIVSSAERQGVLFEGSDGWVFVTRGTIEAKNADLLYESDDGPSAVHLYRSDNHYRNFIDCVLSRQQPIAPVETAHRSITIAHLGNISLRLGRDLKWDPQQERVIDDDAANAMLSRPMRAPWKLPEI
jgi:predicted dehydrogenase